MARPINTFSGLHIDEEEEPNKINIERKATKKLREIESLKKKDKNDLTNTEKEKISRENYWRDILNPPEKEEYKESLKEKEKRLKKEKERQKKEEEKKRKKEEKERKKKEKEEKKMQEIYEEQKKKNERYEQRKKNYEEQQKHYEQHKKQHEEWKKQNEQRKKKQENDKDETKILFKEIEAEYKKVLKYYDGNVEKAFRKCSLKYHPDKNPGNEVTATENQKILGEIYEKYSK